MFPPKSFLTENFTGLIFNSINVPFIRFVEFKFLHWDREWESEREVEKITRKFCSIIKSLFVWKLYAKELQLYIFHMIPFI